MLYLKNILSLVALLMPASVYAEFEWVSFTLDNDLFLGDDGGYTNGLYLAFYDSEKQATHPEPSWLLTPLQWSIRDTSTVTAISAYTLGQTMVTPADITVTLPDKNDMPYAGLLFINSTFLSVNTNYADKIGVTLGVLGPLSLAEQSQKLIHKMLGSEEPKGWDTQLENELVFQLDRARAWQFWQSNDQRWDLVTLADLTLGTISSAINAGAMIRYGTRLSDSYATTLFGNTRTTNPISIAGSWNLYAGIKAGYKFNDIFMDGNTYRDSHSIEYKHESVGVMLGFTFSWDGYSLALAATDSNLLVGKSGYPSESDARFGTLTLAIQL